MIKKIILPILFFAFTITSVTAQDTSDKNRVGIKAGYNLAGVSFDDDNDVDTNGRSGFHIGIFGEVALNDFVSIQPELLYSQQGYELENSTGTFTHKIDYINLPLMLKFYPVNVLYLEAGPQIGVAINDEVEFDSNFDLFDGEASFDPKSVDFGLNLGAGVNLSQNFQLGARYHFGLGDIYDEGSPNNRVFSISAMLSF